MFQVNYKRIGFTFVERRDRKLLRRNPPADPLANRPTWKSDCFPAFLSVDRNEKRDIYACRNKPTPRIHSQAADSWVRVRRIPSYELVAGQAFFRHIFALTPAAVSLYAFDCHEDSPEFRQHSVGVVTTLGQVVCTMLGDGISDAI